MYPTAEVRWFLQGPVPHDVKAWFQRRTGSVEQEPPRVDRYLRLLGSEGLNVKLREGRIEIKQRVGQASVMRFHERVSGLVETWRKWSFEIAEPGGSRSETAPPGSSWIGVRKERRLRAYRVENGEDVVAWIGPGSPREGCELELTRVRAAGQVWWTVAFEAFGDESTLRENLLLVVRNVLSADEPPLLPGSNTCGYAAWLSSLIQAEARP